MEKISGILPATSRVSTVDLASSGSVRPGAPDYGRPIGSSALNKEAVTNHIGKDIRSNTINDLSTDFFMNKTKAHTEIEHQIDQMPLITESPLDHLESRWEAETSKGQILDLEA